MKLTQIRPDYYPNSIKIIHLDQEESSATKNIQRITFEDPYPISNDQSFNPLNKSLRPAYGKNFNLIQFNILDQRSFLQLNSAEIEVERQSQTNRNLFSSLMIRHNINKFIKKLKEAINLHKMKLNNKQFLMIQDQASDDVKTFKNSFIEKNKKRKKNCLSKTYLKVSNFIKRIQKNTFLVNCQQKIKNCAKSIPVISPDNQIKWIWDIFIALIKLWFMLMIPIQVSFENNILFSDLHYLTSTFISLMVFDLVLQVNTGFYQFGYVVTSRQKIIEQLDYGFGVEFMTQSLLIIFSFVNKEERNWWDSFLLIFFFQLQNVQKTKQKLEEILDLSKFYLSIYRIIKLIFTLFYVEHICGCVWYIIGDISRDYTPINWIEGNDLRIANINRNDWQKNYLESIYFTTVTMMTVGYGDITPQSKYFQFQIQCQDSIEKIFTILFMTFSSIQLSYSVSTVGQIINDMTKESDEKQRKMQIINNYLKKKKISLQYQHQVREYLNYIWNLGQSQQNEEEQLIISQLSDQLRQKLILDSTTKLLKENDFFYQNFSEDLINRVALKMKTIQLYPEDDIQQDDNYDQNLYIVEEGEIKEYIEGAGISQRQTKLRVFKKGQAFNAFQFITITSNIKKYKSVGITKLMKISSSDFLNIIKDLPVDYEKFCQLRDEVKFQCQQDKIGEKCNSCKSTEHSNIYCYMTHYKVDKEKLIKKFTFKKEQKRKQKKRKRQKRQFDAYSYFDINQESAECIQNDYKNLNFLVDSDEEKQEDQINNHSKDSPGKSIFFNQPAIQQTQPSEQNYTPNDYLEQRAFSIQRRSSIIQKSFQTSKVFQAVLAQKSKFSYSNNQEKKLENEQQQIPVSNLQKQVTEESQDNSFSSSSSSSNSSKKLLSKKNYLKNLYLNSKIYWHKRLTKIINTDYEEYKKNINQNDIEQLELLTIQMKMFLPENSDLFAKSFESSREFRYFFPHNNCEAVISKIQFSPQEATIAEERQNFMKLGTYMIFPTEFLEKYRNVYTRKRIPIQNNLNLSPSKRNIRRKTIQRREEIRKFQ